MMNAELLVTLSVAGAVAYILYLKSQVACLRRKIAQKSETSAAQPAPPPGPAELQQLRERVKVLEKIAIEDHSRLETEIAALRRTG